MTSKFIFPVIASAFLMTSSHAVNLEDYQQCLTDIQRKFSECQRNNGQDPFCEIQRKSDQESCEKLLTGGSQQSTQGWTPEDDEMLEVYSVNKEGFLSNIKTYNECTDKIDALDKKLQTINNSTHMTWDIKETLHKLCKVEFTDNNAG